MLKKLLDRTFLTRLLEQAAVAAAAAFTAVVAVPGASVDKSLLIAGLAAAGRAVYGVLVKSVNDPEQPSVK